MLRLSFFIFILTLFGCKGPEPPEVKPGEADFSKVIAVGGNYLSGYQNGALYEKAQLNSLASLIGRQCMQAGAEDFGEPLLPIGTSLGINLKPWESEFVSSSALGDRTDCEDSTSLGPVKDLILLGEASSQLQAYSGTVHNFAIPYATLKNLTSPAFGQEYTQGGSPFYHRIASNPGTSTVLEDALGTDPTFLILWLGMEDIYNYATHGGYGKSIPSPAAFEQKIDSVLSALTANGAKGVIANIPSIDHFPFYNLIPWNSAELSASKADSLNEIYHNSGLTHINFSEGNNGFIIDDTTANENVRQMVEGEKILLTAPLDSMKCNFYGILFKTIHDQYTLDLFELAKIKYATRRYNEIIAAKAEEYDLAFVDANGFFNTVQTGVKWNGADFNMEFVSGGFLSLDGYHPNQKGYGLLANEFITAINQHYKATIPTTNCSDCDGILFP